jgi:hypothetical protein
MKDRPALREIEKRAWTRTFEHGMWDMVLGSMFLTFGVSILVSFPAVAGLWVVVLLPSFRELGRRVVLSRIGHVRFRGRRQRAKARVTGMLVALAVLGVAVFGLVMWAASSKESLPAWGQWVAHHLIILIGLIWGGAMAVTAWLVDFPRLYGYGALIFASLVVTDFMPGYSLGITLVIAGGLILLAGIVLFVRFLRRYPRQDLSQTESHE